MYKNLDEKRAYDAAYRLRNREKKNAEARAERIRLREAALLRYGSSCAECSFDNEMALQIDHIHDDGANERHALGGQNFSGYRFYRWLEKQGWPDGYQTLCANCNTIKYVKLRMSR